MWEEEEEEEEGVCMEANIKQRVFIRCVEKKNSHLAVCFLVSYLLIKTTLWIVLWWEVCLKMQRFVLVAVLSAPSLSERSDDG